MCKIEENFYIRPDGHRSVFQDTILCERGQRRGKTCSDARVRRFERNAPGSSPPRTVTYHTLARRPSISKPSIHDDTDSSMSGVHVEVGNVRMSERSHRSAVSVTTDTPKRQALVKADDAVADASEVSDSPTNQSRLPSVPEIVVVHKNRINSRTRSSHYHTLQGSASGIAMSPRNPRLVVADQREGRKQGLEANWGSEPSEAVAKERDAIRTAHTASPRHESTPITAQVEAHRQLGEAEAWKKLGKLEVKASERGEDKSVYQSSVPVQKPVQDTGSYIPFDGAPIVRPVSHPSSQHDLPDTRLFGNYRSVFNQHNIQPQTARHTHDAEHAIENLPHHITATHEVPLTPSANSQLPPAIHVWDSLSLTSTPQPVLRGNALTDDALDRKLSGAQDTTTSMEVFDRWGMDLQFATLSEFERELRGLFVAETIDGGGMDGLEWLSEDSDVPPLRNSVLASMLLNQEEDSDIDLKARGYVPPSKQVLEPVSMPEGSGYDEVGSVSAGSTYASSIFTVESLATDASELSHASGYSQKQIATATKVLVNILQDDYVLVPLYQRAIVSASIGPGRLQRHLHRRLKYFARDLGEEHSDRLEYLASRLVAIRARYLAKLIVVRYFPVQLTPLSSMHRAEDSNDEESDGENEQSSVDDKDFQDLSMFRQFLVESNAFATLRSEVEAFVSPKVSGGAAPVRIDPLPKSKDYCVMFPQTWEIWLRDFAQTLDFMLVERAYSVATKMAVQLSIDAFVLTTDNIFIATGLLEPPLRAGLTRLRWTCRCGDLLFSDVAEFEAGAIAGLVALMEETTDIKVSVTPYRQSASGQQYTGSRHLGLFGLRSDCQNIRPQTPMSQSSQLFATSTTSANTSTTTQNSVSADPLLHLMACVHGKGPDKILLQDRVQDVKTDQALVEFLRTQYRRYRSRLRSFISLKCVQGIHFVRFHLPLGDSVIIVPHETACNQSSTPTCECLPPRSRVEPLGTSEYKCRPVPPKTFPPIPPEYLLSFFTCVKEPHPASKWMIEQFPKRSWGELFGGAEQPAEGWGIYYKERWDPKKISRAVLGLLVVSLVFGIVWTEVRGDVQGAFGVAAWIVGVGGAGLGVLVTSVNSL